MRTRRGQGYGQLMGWHGASRPAMSAAEYVRYCLKGQARWREGATSRYCQQWQDRIAEVA